MDRITEIEHEDILSSHDGSDDDDDAQESGRAAKRTVVDKKQNRAVRRVRVAVFFVMLLAAVAVSLSAYYYTKGAEEEAFEEHFIDQAHRIVDTFNFSAQRRLQALQGFANQITSHAMSSGETFPMVTLPDFERQATTSMLLAEVVAMLVMPIVPTELKWNWTAYSVANEGWVNQGLALQQERSDEDKEDIDHLQSEFDKAELVNSTDSDVDTSKHVPPIIFKLKPGTTTTMMEDGPGPYAPIWTFAPAIPAWNLVNFNSFSHPTRTAELQAMVQAPQPLLSLAADFRNNDPLTANRKEVMNLFLNRWKNGTFEYEAGPVSDIYIPVFDGFGPEKRLGQVLAAYVYWQSFFINLLPHGENGVICILDNSCGQSFTYVLHGPEPSYVGPGDLHESKYDDLVVETGMGAFLGAEAVPSDPMEAQCFYNVKVYPSSEMEADYVTDNPLYFCFGLLAVFLFTSAVFLTYDRLVTKRHSMVEIKAIQSTAVVQSLFPEKVRERLYESSPTETGSQKREGFLAKDKGINSLMDDVQNIVDENMPIADLYPECTVLFADICGFTSWSSLHTPVEVFKLLETLYATFDKIAKKRKVFKVETIGDCYVAVTGLPERQDNHAVIMAKFAVQCLMQVNPVLHSLIDKLGVETAQLSMRFGLNSGPVTAGVLRGEKARFQLFGDTVNTAARMESNGHKGRIHTSESTAHLLIAAGLDSWVVPREKKIEAKGKGKLQTFWISPDVDLSCSARSYQSRQGHRPGRGGPIADTEEETERSLVDRAVGRLVKSVSAHSLNRQSSSKSLTSETTPRQFMGPLSSTHTTTRDNTSLESSVTNFDTSSHNSLTYVDTSHNSLTNIETNHDSAGETAAEF